ncbi:helix-turn-helix domain-containing protein [Mesorhizobium caraganae]|uniref:helix-turn-helix domain-containing protein n=1 Tax=Mesorhizobium caraganae TaxID=483206 RepID=UPI003ECCF111
MSNMEMARRIRELREAKGFSKSDLARRTGVTTTAVWNWETNGRRPHDETLKQIALCLGSSVQYLLTGQDEVEVPARHTAALASRTVQSIIDDAQAEIAKIVGLSVDRVKIRVEMA